MKNKFFKAVLFTMALATAAIPASAAFAAESTEVGAYEAFEDDEIPEEALEKFELAASVADIDVTLNPIALLETQVVSGTNYRFLAEQVPNNPEDPVSTVVVTVYADLNGNAEISTIEESDVNLLVPENARISVEDTKDFSMNAAFGKDDFDFEQKTLHVDLYEEALYDALEVHELAVGDYVQLPDGNFIQVTSLDESADANNNNVISVNMGTLNLAANEGGTYNCPTDNDLIELTKVGEGTLSFAEDVVFTDCTTDPGSCVEVAPEDLENYINTMDDTEGAMPSDFSYLNTTISVTGGVITEITRTWRP